MTNHRIDCRLNLESWLPPHLFKPINHVLVGFGQVVCLPVGPRCDVCFLGTEKICPSRVANVNVKGRKVVEFGFIESGSVEETAVKEEKKDVPPRGYWHAAAVTSPVLRKVEIEYGTDPLPAEPNAEAIPTVKQEIKETLDDIDKAIQEPGIQQPEQVVELVMGELAEEQGENVQVIKAE
jgi:endonuclease-3